MTPICAQCRHAMLTKQRISMDAHAQQGNGKIQRIGPVVEEVHVFYCKVTAVPIAPNPCILECSEFKEIVNQIRLFKPEAMLEPAGRA